MNSNEQKKWIIDALDKAIQSAQIEYLDVSIELNTNFTNIPHIVLKVPDGPTFRVINSKQALTGFRNQIMLLWNREIRQPKAKCPKENSKVYRKDKIEDWEGVYYIQEYKPQALKLSHYKLTDKHSVYKGSGWFGNDEYMVKGDFSLDRDNIKWKLMPDLKEVLSETGKQMACIVCEYRDAGTGIPVVVVKSEKVTICLQAVYADIIMGGHPDAKPYVFNDEERILFLDGEQPVGVVQSYKCISNILLKEIENYEQ